VVFQILLISSFRLDVRKARTEKPAARFYPLRNTAPKQKVKGANSPFLRKRNAIPKFLPHRLHLPYGKATSSLNIPHITELSTKLLAFWSDFWLKTALGSREVIDQPLRKARM
jgi:hypothetical protein